MAWLGDSLGEGALGSPRCNKDRIEERIFDRRRDLFSSVGLIFFDTTSIYFEGEGGESLGGNKGYRRYPGAARGGHFEIDEKRIKREARYDGICVLRTDTDMDAVDVARTYKMLWMVEKTFRTAKSALFTRPTHHKCDETIRGHVCSFLALVLEHELKLRMEKKGLK
jgi:hypothetical protein